MRSPFVSVCVCKSFSQSVCPPLSVCLSVCLTPCLSVSVVCVCLCLCTCLCLSVCLFVSLCVCKSFSQSVYSPLSVCLPDSMFLCLFPCLCLLSVSVSICLSPSHCGFVFMPLKSVILTCFFETVESAAKTKSFEHGYLFDCMSFWSICVCVSLSVSV